MNLISGGKNGQCMLYALAMLLNESPESLIEEIGHDGLTKVWNDLPEPYCYPGFHIQEVIDVLFKRKQALVCVDAMPTTTPHPLTLVKFKVRKSPDPHFMFNNVLAAAVRIKQYLENRQAILVGETKKGSPHAVAWDGQKVYDSRGKIYGLTLDDKNCDFQIRTAYIRVFLQ